MYIRAPSCSAAGRCVSDGDLAYIFVRRPEQKVVYENDIFDLVYVAEFQGG